jgi:hypothetical protein
VTDQSGQDRVQRLSAAPIMIVGAPRSGTTWVQRMMLADLRCCGGQETHFFATFGRVLRDFDDKASLDRPHGLACYWSRDDLVAAIADLWRRTVADVIHHAPEAVRLVEKTPDHALWLDVIGDVVPDASIVHVVRDSRAVCASLLAAGREPWGRRWAPKSTAAAIDVWRRHVEAVRSCGRPVHQVHYEDLHRDAAGVLRALWTFVGLDVTDEVLGAIVAAHAFEAERRRNDEDSESARPGPWPAEPPGFYREGTADGWRRALGRRDRARIWRETADLMEALGYDREGRIAAP